MCAVNEARRVDAVQTTRKGIHSWKRYTFPEAAMLSLRAVA